MPYYKDVFRDLYGHLPAPWKLVHYGDGVYLWPLKNPKIIHTDLLNDIKLRKHQILFEFHRTRSGTARILARARYDKPNRAAWDEFWKKARAAGAEIPESRPAKKTRSVAKWVLTAIKAQSNAKKSAKEIIKYLQTPPRCLTKFRKNI